MRLIAAATHRVLDFVTVAAFALAPSVLHVSGLAATLSYVLAAVHLGLTLLTQFPGAGARPVSLPLHGVIECIVGLALVVLPWVLSWSGMARTFYIAAGVVILAVWTFSQYRATASQAAA